VAAGPLRIEAPAEIVWVEREAAMAAVELEDGSRHQARLIAACDGRGSPLRADAGIGKLRFAYGQTGIVATIAHEHPHHGVAVERFFPTGPFAILPMTGDRSSIVWAAEDPLAADMIALDDAAFADELEERFGETYGRLEVVGPRYHYPLQMVRSERITDRRLALVGDAARAIHPIAGQGWNLALRDVGALAELIVDEARLGLDPGRPAALERYERWRRFDSLTLIAITDGINRLFNNDLLPLRMAREAGLGVVEQIPPLKRLFMRHAMGVIGDLPRLIRGEAL
jgi:2-octaprenyl-6-methoxyphenol hydroxylase